MEELVWAWWEILFLVVVVAWSAVWKGIALWKSARKSHKAWFIVLLILNTVGILEILYIYIFSKCCEKKRIEKKQGKPIKVVKKVKRK